jgi:hypothetical protein
MQCFVIKQKSTGLLCTSWPPSSSAFLRDRPPQLFHSVREALDSLALSLQGGKCVIHTTVDDLHGHRFYDKKETHELDQQYANDFEILVMKLNFVTALEAK